MSNIRQNRRNVFGISGNFSLLPQITDRTEEQFLEDIMKIHESQYTPINNIPTILGRKINLLALYNAVAKRGGFKKMNTEWSWEGVLTDLKMPIKCANASVALRSIFQRYLESFERIQRNKATINDIEDELQMESENRYKTSIQRTTLTHCNFNPTSMVYRADTHQISSHKRQEAGLSCDLSDVVEFHKLEMSLKSGLVNEIEFSLNTVLLMSFQADGVHLCRNHRLLDLILSTVGIGDFELLKDLIEHDRSTKKFVQFWNDIIVFEEGRKFLLPEIFVTDDYEAPQLDKLNQLFKLYDELTIYDKEGQRVQLVATIIRNLALDSLNGSMITQSHQCMRLIILCCYGSHFALRQIGLEILSMLTFPVVGILVETMKDFIINLINSEDRVDRLRGLELLSHLSDQRVSIDNTEFLSGLPKHFFASLISMLIIHDLHIVVLALESIYGLSEVDSCLCIKLVNCSTETLHTLFILLSLEAQVMGTQSLIRIRVMQGPAIITTTNCSTSNQSTSLHRPNSQQSVSTPKQLATSLMPPPPVPTHKIPTTTISSPHNNLCKPQVYITTEESPLRSRPQIIQKIYPVITRNNTVLLTPSSNTLLQTSIPPIVKSELITTSTIPLLTSEIVSTSRASVSDQTTLNNVPTITTPFDQTTKCNTNTNHTVVTISPLSSSLSMNLHPPINRPCISTVVTNQGPHEPASVTNLNKVMTIPAAKVATGQSRTESVNNNSLSAVHQVTEQIFTNKQDFVKSWLLNNYKEFSQCTVPLFVMYKQLQVAVQNYFKDSEMVTAEEFHKLVRILFPQVQLVQLTTAAGTVEIHYYNLKVSQKVTALDSLLESPTSMCKPIVSSTNDTNYSTNIVPRINSAQTNCVVAQIKSDNVHNDQKHLKRNAVNMVNGHTTESDHKEMCPNKKPRIENECHVTSSNINNHKPIAAAIPNSKEIQCNNGIITQFQNKNQLSQFDERHYQPNSNVHISQVLNGTVSEELKHSDSETRPFSSSTVSPIHCESLANGTDGSSEGTMDSEYGRVISTIPHSKALPNGTSNTPSQISSRSTVPATITNTSEPDTNKRNPKKNNFNQLGRTRSRFRTNIAGSKGKQRGSTSQRPHNLSYLYICEWDNCLQSFDKPQKVYGHVYTNHFMTLRTEVESMCYWAGCNDSTQRTPLPLLNHVNEQHCNNVALETARQIRLAKEKEKSTNIITSEPNIVKSEMESSPKLLKFCSSNRSHVPLTSPVSTVISPATSISTCATSTEPTSTTSHHIHIQSTNSSPSVEPVSSICSPSFTQTTPVLSTMTTSTPIVQQTTVLSPRLIESEETLTADSNISRCPPQDLPQVTTTVTIPHTVIPPPPIGQSTAVITPAVPVVTTGIKEGPVTKHIRFLSALILRNLCQCSQDARRFVAARHQSIFEMSISGCESSRVLSECLFYSSIENSFTSHSQN